MPARRDQVEGEHGRARRVRPDAESDVDASPHSPAEQPAPSPALLAASRVGGRGNMPVQAALLHTMQQTHGNRALQRLMRQKDAPTTTLPLQRQPTTVAPRRGGVTFRDTYTAAIAGSGAWSVTLIIANAPQRGDIANIRDQDFYNFVYDTSDPINAVLLRAGSRARDRRVTVRLSYRRGMSEDEIDTQAATATTQALGLDKPAPPDPAKLEADAEAAKREAAVRAERAESYLAEAANERTEGKHEFEVHEKYKRKEVKDRDKFLFWAQAQHAPHYIAEVWEEEAQKILKGGPIPFSENERLFSRINIRDSGYKRAMQAAEKEYPIYLARSTKWTDFMNNAPDINAMLEFAAQEVEEWDGAIPYQADLKAQWSPMREQFGSVRGDLLAAEIQGSALRAQAANYVPELRPIIAELNTANALMIGLSGQIEKGVPDDKRANVAEAVVGVASSIYRMIPAKDNTATPTAPVLNDPFMSVMYELDRDAIGEIMIRLPKRIAAARTPEDWQAVFKDYRLMIEHLDAHLDVRLRTDAQKSAGALPGADKKEGPSQLADQLSAVGTTTRSLHDLDENHPDAQRIPAIFYPQMEYSNIGTPGAPEFRPKGMPWVFYLHKRQYWSEDGDHYEWTLIDMTSPQKHKVNEAGNVDDRNPPSDLFKQLNSKLRFPKGKLWLQMPNGEQSSVPTTEPWQLSEFLTYVGMAAGAVALALATFGASIPTTVVVIGAAATAGAAIADISEKSEQGMLTTKDAVVDVLSIVSSLASAGQALGKFFVAESMLTGKFAQLAALSGRLQAPLRLAGLGADAASFAILSADTWAQYKELDQIEDLEQREYARLRLLGTFMLSGAMTIVSIRDEVKMRRAGNDIHLGSESATTNEAVTNKRNSGSGSNNEPPGHIADGPGPEDGTRKVNYHPGQGDAIPPGPDVEPITLNPNHYTAENIDDIFLPGQQGANYGKLKLTQNGTNKSYIFKPQWGEADIIGGEAGIVAGERYRRAPASSAIGRELGIQAPDTTVVMYQGRVGSLQEWVPNGKLLEDVYKMDRKLYDQIMSSQMKADMDMFDYVLGNMDRHAGNLMVEFKPGTNEVARLIPIDMDAAFPPSALRYTMPGYHGQAPMPATVSPQMRFALRHMSANRESLSRTLSVYLSEAEVQGTLRRLDELIAEMNMGGITTVR